MERMVMAKLNLDYYTGTDQYSDGDIEQKIYDLVCQGKQLNEMENPEFPVVYHLSKVRQNILLWYPFKENASILEVGSGCGAITGLLCEKAGRVVSVELSKRRASINYERNKDYENLEIIVGNLNDVPADSKFDYVILNGVFEYAASFTEGDTPYETFLSRLAERMHDKGTILMAIENKLGIKYFAGAPEDHTDIHFLGMNQYRGISTVRTFSKKEMEELCERTGLVCNKFYYPYPDYKFPYEIFTDDSINTDRYGRQMFQFNENRLEIFDENAVEHDLAKEKIADRFANSFLVEITREKMTSATDIDYVKINTDRKEAFQICTTILRDKDEEKVVKFAASPAAKHHIENMDRTAKEDTNANGCMLQGVYDGAGTITYPFLHEKTLDDMVEGYLSEKNAEMIRKTISRVYETFFADAQIRDDYATEEFQNVFGCARVEGELSCVENCNIDLILDNIFLEKERLTVIDNEWVMPFFVPTAYVMWRLINELYYKHMKLYDLIDREELERSYGIIGERKEIFYQWEEHFAYGYVGSYQLKRFAREPIKANLAELLKEQKGLKQVESKLYLDCGEGIKEENTVKEIADTGVFTLEFSLAGFKDIRNVRWDPAETPCKCRIQEITCDGKPVKWTSSNRTYRKNDDDVFMHSDPYYFLEGEFAGGQKLVIRGEITCYTWKDSALTCQEQYQEQERTLNNLRSEYTMNQAALNKLQAECEAKQRTADQLSSMNRDKDQAIAVYQNYIATIEDSKLWYLYRGKEFIKKRIKRLMGKNDENPALQNMQEVQTPQPTQEQPFSYHYSIDEKRLEQSELVVKGWMFHEEKSICKLELVLRTAETEVLIPVEYGRERLDVGDAFGLEAAKLSGFLCHVDLKLYEDVQMLLMVTSAEDVETIAIGDLKKNTIDEAAGVLAEYKIIDSDLARLLKENVLAEMPSELCVTEKADVIVPIYNGYDYLVKLFPQLLRTKMDCTIYLVDDKSTDSRVIELEDTFAREHENVVVLRNKQNYGFVKTVNQGLRHCKHHVALVNTDVELPEYWLERLIYPMVADPTIASTTPYSNSATIFSFPNFGVNNPIYRGMDIDTIDAYFARVIPRYETVPTGMGFCMGMNRKAIKKVGVLDYKAFSKGFGEENDWCQRAIKKGFRNVHVENLFVYHKHGGSFLAEEKQRLLEENLNKLFKRYPNYQDDVAAYCAKDPNRDIRDLVKVCIDTHLTDRESILAFDHNLGGGATSYLEKKTEETVAEGNVVSIVRYNAVQGIYEYIFRNDAGKLEFMLYSLDELHRLAKYIKVDKIVVNELVTYPSLEQTLETILEVKRQQQAYLLMLMHDYFSVCPSINLVGQNGVYCQFPDEAACDACFMENHFTESYRCPHVRQWQKMWKKFFLACDEVRAFSEDTCHILEQQYGLMDNVTLVPHVVDYMPKVPRKSKMTDTYNIGLIGVLTRHKGLDLVDRILTIIEERQLNVNIILIGQAEDDSLDGYTHFRQTGRYSVEDLPRLVLENDIDLFFISSIWPETFSYTTEEVMQMGFPVASFAVGAPAERISRYEKGVVIPEIRADVAVDTMLQYLEQSVALPAPTLKKVVFVLEYESFSSRYRLEHMREQLWCEGIPSEVWSTEDLPENIEWDTIDQFVIYRCRYQSPLKELMEQMKQNGKKIVYDIDDYIFDYDQIKDLEFMSDSEYEDFEQYSSLIRECMEQSDAFTTSTENMRKVIIEHFPGKPVYVNRNLASAQMQILSNLAQEKKVPHAGQIVLGYFSGSKTHNGDFELISNVLLEVMEKNPNVILKIVGCLELPEKYERMEGRIQRVGFVDWKELPELIASIDINLMPLEDTLFHRCKSENKWMEAALVKVPTIASYNDEMECCTKQTENILLCKNASEWKEHLEEMIQSRDLGDKIAARAYEYVAENKITLVNHADIAGFIEKGI